MILQHSDRPPDTLPFPRTLDPDARFTVRETAQSMWIVHEDRGVFEWRDGKLRQFDNPILIDLVKKATTGAVGREAIGAITRTRDGAFWISQSSRGVARVDLPANYFAQTSGDEFAGIPLTNGDMLLLVVRSGALIAYGAATDNITNDPSIEFARKIR